MSGFVSVDGLEWAAVGGYYMLDGYIKSRRNDRDSQYCESLIRGMSDRELEDKVRREVAKVANVKFNEIWRHIECFKRENFHIVEDHYDSYWELVGKERFPFTMTQFALQTGRVPNKSDEKMIRTYFGWTITLIMNTLGKHSVMEASRYAFRKVYGDSSWAWTREYG